MLWNVASLAVQGISLIVWTILVGKYRGQDALGVFSLVYAVYIVLSQVAVGGVHASVLRHVSFHQDDRPKCVGISAAYQAAACSWRYASQVVGTRTKSM